MLNPTIVYYTKHETYSGRISATQQYVMERRTLVTSNLLAKACGANTEGPNSALPIATEPLRYFKSESGAAE